MSRCTTLDRSRVLEKCAFRRDHAQEAKAPTPDDGVEEFIFVLDA
jgi:hypothetical protein